MTSEEPSPKVQVPRRRIITKSTDGTQHITEFDNESTTGIKHTSIKPDGSEENW